MHTIRRVAYFFLGGRIGFSALGGAAGLLTGMLICRGGSIGVSAEGGLLGRSDGPGKPSLFRLKGFLIVRLLLQSGDLCRGRLRLSIHGYCLS